MESNLCKCGNPRRPSGRYCQPCANAHQRRRRKLLPLTPEERQKNNARRLANYYQSTGLLTPQPCEVCGTTEEIEKHHDDYSKPLCVRWRCRDHHLELHGKIAVPRELIFKALHATP